MENKRTSIQELVDVVSRQTDFTKKITEEFLHELIQVIQVYLLVNSLLILNQD